jgi:cyclic pyranopterin phosphate synthase
MGDFTHRDDKGQLNMVNVGGKTATFRRARASGQVNLKTAYEAVKNDELKKGSVVECARIAGIMAAKNTGSLIPLCHPLNLNHVAIEFNFENDDSVVVEAICECEGKTGVEMEALTAVSVACLTIYDMAKSVDKNMEITNIQLLEKEGGKSGNWVKK